MALAATTGSVKVRYSGHDKLDGLAVSTSGRMPSAALKVSAVWVKEPAGTRQANNMI